jgi:hypothetical protein
VRRALSLAELVLSLMIVTLVMGAATSAVLLVSRAAPTTPTEFDNGAATAAALQRIAVELRYATAFSRKHDRQPAFTVADRAHGAAGPETIEYDWSGVAGDPLIRRYNGVAETLLAAAHEVRFAYQTALGLSDAADDRLRSVSVTIQVDADASNTWQTEVYLLNEFDPSGNAIAN